jgi:hypothetical protein
MSVNTDIRTRRPTDRAAQENERRRLLDERDGRAAAARGIADSPQAAALRDLVFEQIVQRVQGLLSTDETLQALQAVLKRIGLVEVGAEEAAARIMERAVRRESNH